jgi:hypothetical protein
LALPFLIFHFEFLIFNSVRSEKPISAVTLQFLLAGFLGGAVAFAHCLGMCGPFALHLAAGRPGPAALARQLLWHAGKTSTYVFLGALVGSLGLSADAVAAPWFQNALAWTCGAVIFASGLSLLGLLPRRLSFNAPAADTGLLPAVFRQFFRQPTNLAAFVLGVVTGFLPCPIILGFLAVSLQSHSVPVAMATMAAVGLGTVWALLLLGLTGSFFQNKFQQKFRRRAAAFAGSVLLLLGLATALRATDTFHHLLGCTNCENRVVPYLFEAPSNSSATPARCPHCEHCEGHP